MSTTRLAPLSGRRALVAGVTSDVGLAIAHALADEGATVYGIGRRRDRLAKFAARPNCHAHVLDLADATAVKATMDALGAVDILVWNAAHAPEHAPFLAGGLDTLTTVMDFNFTACARLVAHALPGMVDRRWGRLVAISSLAASIGEAHGPGYCASKAALEGFFRNLAIDYAARGVTCNIVAPGPLATERMATWGPAKARRMALATAMGRLGDPADVAAAVRFLASPDAGFVTGETLRVDGGLHLGHARAAMYERPGSTEP